MTTFKQQQMQQSLLGGDDTPKEVPPAVERDGSKDLSKLPKSDKFKLQQDLNAAKKAVSGLVGSGVQSVEEFINKVSTPTNTPQVTEQGNDIQR
jgi:hypothetical protein